MSDSVEMDKQRGIIEATRTAQSRTLLSLGIVSKILSCDAAASRNYGESRPIVLGSRHEKVFCVFVGLDMVSTGTDRTKLILVGTKSHEMWEPNENYDFSVEDCMALERLYDELGFVALVSAPDYDLETGRFSNAKS